MPTKATSAEPYSNASSSYWPKGWGWERYSDPTEDITTLPDEELEKIQEGMREVLGEDGFNELINHLTEKWDAHQEKEEEALRANAPIPEYTAPDYLRQWRRRCKGAPWGFYAFRTALYGEDEKWDQFKTRFESIADIPFLQVIYDHYGHEYEEVAEARNKFTIHWIEDDKLAGANADVLRKRYAEVQKENKMGVMFGLDMFLCASPEAVESVLSPSDEDLPTIKTLAFRDEAPFVLAVLMEESMHPDDDDEEYDAEDPTDEANWYKPVFKVPIEMLANELWMNMEDPIMELGMITRNVRGSTELGGELPKIIPLDEPYEHWWGVGPTPRSIKRRRLAREGRE